MRIIQRLAVSSVVLLVTLSGTGLHADEGRIPISGPTTIMQPGSYIVTRDFTAPSGSAITIQSSNVTLDLNGRTLTGSAGCTGSNDVIVINEAVPTQGLVIRNGRLLSGCNGIGTAGSAIRARVRIEDVEIGNSSGNGVIIFFADLVDVLRCHVHGAQLRGIRIDGTGTAFKGRFLDNQVEHVNADGLLLNGLYAGEVRRNVVTDFGSTVGGSSGIYLAAGSASWGAGGNLVEGNTVSAFPNGAGTGDDFGIFVDSFSPNNLVAQNVATNNGSSGILCFSDETRIERNVVSHNGNQGIYIGGSRSHLEENQVQFNTGVGACGIYFVNGNSHTYRNNIVTGNTTVPDICTAAGNTNAGGNWCSGGVLCP